MREVAARLRCGAGGCGARRLCGKAAARRAWVTRLCTCSFVGALASVCTPHSPARHIHRCDSSSALRSGVAPNLHAASCCTFLLHGTACTPGPQAPEPLGATGFSPASALRARAVTSAAPTCAFHECLSVRRCFAVSRSCTRSARSVRGSARGRGPLSRGASHGATGAIRAQWASAVARYANHAAVLRQPRRRDANRCGGAMPIAAGGRAATPAAARARAAASRVAADLPPSRPARA